MSTDTPVTAAVAALRTRAGDIRLKLIPGLADDLQLIAAALAELDARTQPLPSLHPETCECRECWLVRIASAQPSAAAGSP